VLKVSEPMAFLESEELSGEVVTVHAEDESMFAGLPDTCTEAHNIVRNMDSELSAVERVLASGSEATLNLAHLTTKESVMMARRAGARFELTPHHLLLHDAMGLGPLGKVNPPLRHRDVARALFELYRKGEGDIVASDHAPHTLDEKGLGFEGAPSGVPGVETRMPLLMALAIRGRTTLETVRDSCCKRPAELFGLNKGVIAEGFDADLAFYDPVNVVKIKGEGLHSKCGWTVFEDFEGLFPSAVMLRGQLIVKDEKIIVERSGVPL
jgi:dihydroorotase